jgi:hypothetical protein
LALKEISLSKPLMKNRIAEADETLVDPVVRTESTKVTYTIEHSEQGQTGRVMN